VTTYAAPTSLGTRIFRRLSLIVLARLPTGRWLRKLPMLPSLYGRSVLNRRDHTGLHWGRFPSYAQALAAIPPTRRSGWDFEESAKLWVDNIDPVIASTYPVLFWLRQTLNKGSSVLDLGGSIGLSYYGYRRFSKLPEDLQWTVVEVPHIAQQGRLVAEREQAAGLHFEEDLANAPACDVLLSAGAMQYLELSVPEMLARLKVLPKYIVLNKLPVSDADEAWTLQNYGPGVAPMRLYNRSSLIGAFEQAGYRLVHSWAVENLDCLIPFHPDAYIGSFSGFALERVD